MSMANAFEAACRKVADAYVQALAAMWEEPNPALLSAAAPLSAQISADDRRPETMQASNEMQVGGTERDAPRRSSPILLGAESLRPDPLTGRKLTGVPAIPPSPDPIRRS